MIYEGRFRPPRQQPLRLFRRHHKASKTLQASTTPCPSCRKPSPEISDETGKRVSSLSHFTGSEVLFTGRCVAAHIISLLVCQSPAHTYHDWPLPWLTGQLVKIGGPMARPTWANPPIRHRLTGGSLFGRFGRCIVSSGNTLVYLSVVEEHHWRLSPAALPPKPCAVALWSGHRNLWLEHTQPDPRCRSRHSPTPTEHVVATTSLTLRPCGLRGNS